MSGTRSGSGRLPPGPGSIEKKPSDEAINLHRLHRFHFSASSPSSSQKPPRGNISPFGELDVSFSLISSKVAGGREW